MLINRFKLAIRYIHKQVPHTSQNIQKKRSQSKIYQHICNAIINEENNRSEKNVILSANHSYIANLNISSNPQQNEYHSKQDSSLKTTSTSHILSDSSKRKEDSNALVAKIESEFGNTIKMLKNSDEITNYTRNTIDELCKLEPSMAGMLSEIKNSYEMCIQLKDNDLKADMESIQREKKRVESLHKESEEHNANLLKEIKSNQKYIENQKAIIKELKAEMESKNDLQKYKEHYLQAKEDNKKMGKIILKLQAENNELKDKTKSLMSLMKGVSIPAVQKEGIKKLENRETKEVKVPALDLSKIMKNTEHYRPIIKKSKCPHHSSSSSSSESEEVIEHQSKPLVPKLDLSMIVKKDVGNHQEFIILQKEFSKSWKEQLVHETH